MKLKESRQQQQVNNFLQFAMMGMVAFMRVKVPKNDDNSKPPGENYDVVALSYIFKVCFSSKFNLIKYI
jgi:hypothetical protein